MSPIVFLTADDNEMIIEKLSSRLAKWKNEWCVESNNVEISRIQDLSIPDGFEFFSNKSNSIIEKTIGIKYKTKLSKILFGQYSEKVPDDNVFFDISKKATVSLIAEINQLSELFETSLTFSKKTTDFTHKYFRYICHYGDYEVLEIVIPETIVLSFIERDNKLDIKDLIPRKQVIGSEQVKLDIELELGDVLLKSLNDLSVGDILVTEKKISAELNVATNGKVLAKALVGKKGDYKAIQINEIYNEK